MKIALTGGSGGVARAIIPMALSDGHDITLIDRVAHPEFKAQDNLRFVQAEMSDYDRLVETFAGHNAVIHMAAIPAPFRHPDHEVHNNNVVGSYNALRAAAENGIMRVCQASSVNALGLSFSRDWHFDYLPLDEEHPTYNEEPYGLSKWICELQGDSFARRYEGMRIASMRFHWVVPNRELAARNFNKPGQEKHLWAYTLDTAAARACLLSLTADFTGHQAFYITAPDTTHDRPSLELAAQYFPNVPVKGDLSGHRSFFNSGKAERLLNWKHNEP